MNTKHLGINSKLIHAGHKADATGSVNVPIYQTSTFAFRNAAHGAALFAGEEEGYIYTRIGNPTINALEDSVAELENGCGGIATSSGMGAVCTVYLALLQVGCACCQYCVRLWTQPRIDGERFLAVRGRSYLRRHL